MTNRRVFVAVVFSLLMMVACLRHGAQSKVVVEIPAGFNGNFMLEMGVHGAAALPMEGDAYIVSLPSDGKLTTSTFLEKANVVFKNASEGSVWGYSQTVFRTGDGISISGKIEFFVGTKTQYDAEQNKKNHSGVPEAPVEMKFVA
jgi:hypothetical protein